LAGEGAVTPFTLSEAGLRARSREEIVRGELRDTLASGAFARELLTLEPLLESYDGIEIAAATLRLLEQARFERDAARARGAEASCASTRNVRSDPAPVVADAALRIAAPIEAAIAVHDARWVRAATPRASADPPDRETSIAPGTTSAKVTARRDHGPERASEH